MEKELAYFDNAATAWPKPEGGTTSCSTALRNNSEHWRCTAESDSQSGRSIPMSKSTRPSMPSPRSLAGLPHTVNGQQR